MKQDPLDTGTTATTQANAAQVFPGSVGAEGNACVHLGRELYHEIRCRLAVMLFAAALAVLTVAATLRPEYLRCEYLVDPVGIDARPPRLSWKLAPASAGLRGLNQSAYRVVVASNEKSLADDKGDLWDSGKIGSSDTTAIEYAGKPIASGAPCWWKVQVWDQDGTPSEWSKTAHWSMGLLSASDWKAKWIGYDEPANLVAKSPRFEGAKWVWPAADKPGAVPVCERLFIRDFDLSGTIKKATLCAAVDDQFEIMLNSKKAGKSDGKGDAWRRPLEVDVTSLLKVGSNNLFIHAKNTEGTYGGMLLKLVVQTSAGETVVVSDGNFLSSTTDRGPFGPSQEIAPYGEGVWGAFDPPAMVLPAPRYLRHEFSVSKTVRRAVAYFSALGLIELRVNGKAVCDDLFIPGWTDYEKRIYYRACDVTKLLKSGGNAIGAILGDGWYSGYVGYGHHRDHYGQYTRALAQLQIEYEDGTRDTVATSQQWKANTGSLEYSDFLMGETYDAIKEMPGWDESGFRDGQWKPVQVTEKINAAIEAFPGDPVRQVAEFHAESINESSKGVYVLDLGQNIAGFARLRVQGAKGQKVTLRFAERLKPDGAIYTENLRGARATDTYICKGEGTEVWKPRFTFHGFQYIEVTGLKKKPDKDTVVGIAISSDTPPAGKLETSDPMLNKLVGNAWWTQRMNFIDIPTDCPQRDERLGWTGDAQAYIRTACYYADVHAFFTKWLVTLDDAQRADGQFPMVAPVKVAGDDGGPAWADAGVICPWTMYEMYGDKRLLAKHYPQMKKFVEFTKKRSTAELLPPKEFHCFGDWVNINSPTPKEVIYEAYFAHCSQLMQKAAVALGKTDEAQEYKRLFQNVRKAFNEAYVSEDGTILGDSQCAYVLAISFDLLEKGKAKVAADKLVADIEKRGWHLSTGFVGTRDIMYALTKAGRNDVGFRLLHNKTFPSWGFTIANGATSIWERWDGWTPEKGFQDPGMNSFAHYAFGAVIGWVFDQVGGISPISPGFADVRIAPNIDPNLTHAKATYDSIRGPITCNWKLVGTKLTVEVVVPPNVKAEVYIPGKAEPSLVGSGEYTYEAEYKK